MPADPSPFIERAARTETDWIALIRTSEGIEIPCSVKDVSNTGAKIGVPASYHLPDSFMLKVVGKDFICRVTLAWRKGNYAGVRIEKVGKLTPKVDQTHEANELTSDHSYKAIGTYRSRVSALS